MLRWQAAGGAASVEILRSPGFGGEPTERRVPRSGSRIRGQPGGQSPALRVRGPRPRRGGQRRQPDGDRGPAPSADRSGAGRSPRGRQTATVAVDAGSATPATTTSSCSATDARSSAPGRRGRGISSSTGGPIAAGACASCRGSTGGSFGRAVACGRRPTTAIGSGPGGSPSPERISNPLTQSLAGC